MALKLFPWLSDWLKVPRVNLLGLHWTLFPLRSYNQKCMITSQPQFCLFKMWWACLQARRHYAFLEVRDKSAHKEKKRISGGDRDRECRGGGDSRQESGGEQARGGENREKWQCDVVTEEVEGGETQRKWHDKDAAKIYSRWKRTWGVRGEWEEGSEREWDPGGKLITEHAMQFSGSVPPLHHPPPSFTVAPSLPPCNPSPSRGLFLLFRSHTLSLAPLSIRRYHS